MRTTKYNYPQLSKRAEVVSRMVFERAKTLAAEAGIVSDGFPLLVHNALASYEYGHPWSEVKDHKKLRRVAWLLDEKQWQASRALRRLYERLGPDGFIWK